MTAAPLAYRGHPVVVGAGVAGLMTALELAPRPVVVLSKVPLGAEGSTLWAQGGMAAALGADDSPALHAFDTMAAGDGLCDAAIVDRFVRVAPQAIENLARLGVRFDRMADGGFAPGLEAAHSRSRIAHVGGDGAGRELMRALVAAFRLIDPAIRFEALTEDGAAVKPGARVAVVEGPARGVLTAERVALNFVSRMSGVASAAAKLSAAVSHTRARIVCTRKTTPLLRAIEKYGVRAGRGSNHRLGLDDAVLIKDNHVAVAGSVAEAIRRARAYVGHRHRQLNESGMEGRVSAGHVDSP